jgi:hypothetical protein
MRSVFTVLSGILVATASAGEPTSARAPGEAEAFVPIVEQEFGQGGRALDLPARPERQVKADAAQINIECLVIALRASDLTRLGTAVGGPAVVISDKQLAELTEFARQVRRAPPLVSVRYSDPWCASWAESTRKGGVIVTKNATVASGERLLVQELRNLNFIAGIKVDPARLGPPAEDGQLPGEPVIGNLADGLALEAQAETVGKAMRFTLINARMVVPVAFPGCELTTEVAGHEVGLNGQEPCVLTWKSAVPTPCDIAVPPGRSVLIPLRERSLVVLRSPMRALAEKGKMRFRRDGVARFLSQFDNRGYPLEVDTMVLAVFTPQIVKPPTAEF